MRDEVDAQWARLRDAFRQKGIDAPQTIVRCNGDLPPVPGGIRDAQGNTRSRRTRRHCRRTNSIFTDSGCTRRCCSHRPAGDRWSSACPSHVQVVGQPSYDAYEGGQGELYSSAAGDADRRGAGSSIACGRQALLPLDLIRGKRFTFNSLDSMSGIIGLTRDLQAVGESLDIFSSRSESGGHRASIVAVAEGSADVAAIDCESWALAQRFEPSGAESGGRRLDGTAQRPAVTSPPGQRRKRRSGRCVRPSAWS